MKTPARRTLLSLICFATLLAACHATSSHAESPVESPTQLLRVAPSSSPISDIRAQPLKDLNGYFPFTPPTDLAAWESRADDLRTRVKVATGLWPMPDRTPLNPVIHGKVKRDGFTVEKVYFESIPGHFVTGFLFRPAGDDGASKPGKFPGVLCPHGHGGRLQQASVRQVREMIVRGEERFEDSGRSPKLARCAALARMGCVVFIFDMLGYADSQQISYDHAHRYAQPQPAYADGKTAADGRWGFYTVQAESRLQSIMGLQTWNAIRSLDFLEQLPDVDPERLAVTGNSGGGTQTILLGAIDERPVVSFPNGMVSVSMQGGCTCENCSLLRIGTGNVELAALMAPRPQAMTSADDWTIEMMTDGYPQLQQIYSLYNQRDNVLCRDYTHFPHNFNYVSRAIMYSWFNRHLKLGLTEPVVEEDWPELTQTESAIWTDEHPQPAGGDEHERSVTAYLDQQSEQAIAALLNDETESLEPFRNVVGRAWQTIIGRDLPRVGEVERATVGQQTIEGFDVRQEIIQLVSRGEAIPVVTVLPPSDTRRDEVVLWIDGDGKSSLLDEAGKWNAKAAEYLEMGITIVAPDLFGQGESKLENSNSEKSEHAGRSKQRVVENPRQYAGYTYTYNPSLFVQRTHDVMTLVAWMQSPSWSSHEVTLYGRNGAEPIAAAALAVSGETGIEKMLLDTAAFRFDDLTDYRDSYFVPGAVKYGDLPALLALATATQIEVEQDTLPPLAKLAAELVAE